MSLCQVEKIGFSNLKMDIDFQINRCQNEKIIERIKNRDHTVWNSDPDEIINRLGWLDIADRMMSQTGSIIHFREQLLNDGITKVLLLGMGGSSLAPELFAKIFGDRSSGMG